MAHLHAFWTEDAGQDLTEYTLLICTFVLLALFYLSAGFPAVTGIWKTTNSEVVVANTFANGG